MGCLLQCHMQCEGFLRLTRPYGGVVSFLGGIGIFLKKKNKREKSD